MEEYKQQGSWLLPQKHQKATVVGASVAKDS